MNLQGTVGLELMYYQLDAGSSSSVPASKLRPALSCHGYTEDDSLQVSE